MSSLIHIFRNVVKQTCHNHRSFTSNSADPTQVDIYTAYFGLAHGFETPEKGKHEGEVCTNCGQTVESDRCYCTDYAYPAPNVYEVTVSIPCWVTHVEVRAKSGEYYEYMWDNNNPGAWCRDNTEIPAEKMLERLLSRGDFISRDSYDRFNVVDMEGYDDYADDSCHGMGKNE